MKKYRLLRFIAALLLLCTLAGCESSAQAHYVRVDNARMTEINARDGMNFQYTLTAYTQTGEETTITFKTSRALKQDAYLCVWVVPVRGAVRWEEVQWEDLPAPAAEKLAR